MVATPEFYGSVLDEAGSDTESLTCLIVAGGTRSSVAAVLGIDFAVVVEDDFADLDVVGWAVAEIPGGVVALERTGYGDPTIDALAELSRDAGAAAVARTNIQAHQRFGCARDGVLLFDDDEYVFIKDRGRVPADLRALFDLAWVDLADEMGEDPEADALSVGLAMAEVVTGLEITAADLLRVEESGFFRAPSMVYARDDG